MSTYSKTREQELLNTFQDKWCQVCNAEVRYYLRWWPHHDKIRHNILRHGKKTTQRELAQKLIDESVTICWNCIEDRKYDNLKGPWPN